jgi:hypothetical protein
MTRLHCTWLAVILFTGCATVAPQQPVADLKSIAGAWRGSNNTGSPVALIVYDDGHFDASVTTPPKWPNPPGRPPVRLRRRFVVRTTHVCRERGKPQADHVGEVERRPAEVCHRIFAEQTSLAVRPTDH